MRSNTRTTPGLTWGAFVCIVVMSIFLSRASLSPLLAPYDIESDDGPYDIESDDAPIDPIAPTLSLADLTQNPPAGSLECPPLTTPIYDRVIPEQENAIMQKIPKIVHISFKNRCVPTDIFADGIQQWKDLLPEYSVYFHDDEAIERLIQQDWPEFPHLHSMIRCMKYKGAMKVDLWRLLVIYKYGGIYSDIDNIPINMHDELFIDKLHPDDSFYSANDISRRPLQNLFAMEPQHPIAYFTIQIVLRNLYNLDNLRNPKLVHTTGPDALQEGFKTYMTITNKKEAKRAKAENRDFKFVKEGTYKGFGNKTIHKTRFAYSPHKKQGEIVEHEGVNMTRKERAFNISGTKHWQKTVYKNRKSPKRQASGLSCREYLYLLDHTDMLDSEAEDWTYG